MECNFPTCNRHAQSNGWCIYHQGYAKGVSVKIPKEIPKKSDTQKEIDKELKKRYPPFLRKKKFICEIGSPECRKKATCVHHTEGRGKNEVLNESTWMAACEPCNSWVESHHAEAEAIGAKKRRHHKKTNPKYDT